MSDGLRDDVAGQSMGHLDCLVEGEQATRYTLLTELPVVSRPLHETLPTRVPVGVHGVTNDQVVRHSRMPNVFERAVRDGRTTGAAAYYRFSELYVRAPYGYVAEGEADGLS
jgi:hypothetical protein